jgi:hypothetical protein
MFDCSSHWVVIEPSLLESCRSVPSVRPLRTFLSSVEGRLIGSSSSPHCSTSIETNLPLEPCPTLLPPGGLAPPSTIPASMTPQPQQEPPLLPTGRCHLQSRCRRRRRCSSASLRRSKRRGMLTLPTSSRGTWCCVGRSSSACRSDSPCCAPAVSARRTCKSTFTIKRSKGAAREQDIQ